MSLGSPGAGVCSCDYSIVYRSDVCSVGELQGVQNEIYVDV